MEEQLSQDTLKNQAMRIFLKVWHKYLSIGTLLKLERVNKACYSEINKLEVWQKYAIQYGQKIDNLSREQIKNRLLNTAIRKKRLAAAEDNLNHFSRISHSLDYSSTVESYKEKCDWAIPKNCCIGSLILSATTEVIGVFSACTACSCYPCCGTGCTACLTTLYPGCFSLSGGSCCAAPAGSTAVQCCGVPTYTCTQMTVVGHGVTWGAIPALLCVGLTLSFTCHAICHNSSSSIRVRNINYVEPNLEYSHRRVTKIKKTIEQHGYFYEATHSSAEHPPTIRMDETTPLFQPH